MRTENPHQESAPPARPKTRFLRAVSLALLLALLPAFVFELLFPVFLELNSRLRGPLTGQPDMLNVYILGESTAAGWPYHPKLTFPKILSYMYDGKLDGKRLRLISLAEPGSYLDQQYWALLRELTLRPPARGLLLVYSGLNETFRGPVDEGPALWTLGQNSFILSKLTALFPHNRQLTSLFGPFDAPVKYRSRLARTLKLARANGLKTVVSTLAGNISDFPPQAVAVFPDKNDDDAFKNARRLEASGRFTPALREYSALLGRSGSAENPVLYFRIGKCLAGTGDFRGARENFKKAVENGAGKRPTGAQNGFIREAAASGGAALAETEKLFEIESPYGLAGYNLFVDVYHPNIEGQLLLARSFAKEIAELYGEAPARPEPGVKEILSFTGFGDADSFKAHIMQITWLAAEMAVTGNLEPLPKAIEYLEKAEWLWRKTGSAASPGLELARCRLMLYALRGDTRGVLRCLEEADFLGGNIDFIRSGGSGNYNTRVVSLVLEKVSLPEGVRRALAQTPPARR